MKNINEITKQLDLLYTEQQLQEKEIFEKMESILVSAIPKIIWIKNYQNWLFAFSSTTWATAFSASHPF